MVIFYTMAKHTRKNKKTYKKRALRKSKRGSILRGGAVFNSPMDFAKVSGGTDNALNTYMKDVSNGPYHTSSRLFLGGKRRNKGSRRAIRGGGGFSADPLNQLGGSQSNAVFAFGTSAGGNWMVNELTGIGNNNGGGAIPYNQNGPTPPLA